MLLLCAFKGVDTQRATTLVVRSAFFFRASSERRRRRRRDKKKKKKKRCLPNEKRFNTSARDEGIKKD